MHGDRALDPPEATRVTHSTLDCFSSCPKSILTHLKAVQSFLRESLSRLPPPRFCATCSLRNDLCSSPDHRRACGQPAARREGCRQVRDPPTAQERECSQRFATQSIYKVYQRLLGGFRPVPTGAAAAAAAAAATQPPSCCSCPPAGAPRALRASRLHHLRVRSAAEEPATAAPAEEAAAAAAKGAQHSETATAAEGNGASSASVTLEALPDQELEWVEPSGGDKAWTNWKLLWALPWRRFKSGSVLTLKLSGAIAEQPQGRFSPVRLGCEAGVAAGW